MVVTHKCPLCGVVFMQGRIEAGIQIGAADAFIAFAKALFFTPDVDVFRQRDVEEEK